MDKSNITINENTAGQLYINSDDDMRTVLAFDEPGHTPGIIGKDSTGETLPSGSFRHDSADACAVPESCQEDLRHSEAADTLTRNQKIIEAVLFAVPGAVEPSMLAKACGIASHEAEAEAEGLKKYLETRSSGILLRRANGKYELYSNPEYFDELVRVVANPKKPELTDVMMETLAIVAEKELVTKAEIEKIRGVKSDFAVGRLCDYGLIEEKGRLGAPGRPMLFGPTDEFYRRFGIDTDHPVPVPDKEREAEILKEADAEISALTDGMGEITNDRKNSKI